MNIQDFFCERDLRLMVSARLFACLPLTIVGVLVLPVIPIDRTSRRVIVEDRGEYYENLSRINLPNCTFNATPNGPCFIFLIVLCSLILLDFLVFEITVFNGSFAKHVDYEDLPGRSSIHLGSSHACCTNKMGNTETDRFVVVHSEA